MLIKNIQGSEVAGPTSLHSSCLIIIETLSFLTPPVIFTSFSLVVLVSPKLRPLMSHFLAFNTVKCLQ